MNFRYHIHVRQLIHHVQLTQTVLSILPLIYLTVYAVMICKLEKWGNVHIYVTSTLSKLGVVIWSKITVSPLTT